MAPEATLSYPHARRDSVVEDHFGTRVEDPYRWLEDPESEETKAFIAAENEVSEQYLNTPIRKQILKALIKYQNYPKFGVPFKEGDYWYSWRNTGLQNQSVLHQHADKTGKNTKIFLDPNTWAEDGTATVGSFKFTEDGSLMAYARGDKGSDWRTIQILQTETGKTLEDKLEHAK
ncbi:prolyl endopeptidase, putative [Eimeria brunetti]|uniref:Prolyl endopeptidase, putative n=1 Tax=Eimeria brunetti TaxID=51314 RepID=U6LG08_9EIME|nr:prolyl endopeptidase, putative [Eimeria brunetti]